MIIVELENVSFHYDGELMMKNLNFAVEEGEFVSIIGQSGSGKTTILRLLSKLERPTAGNIHITSNKVGFMPQKDLLLPWRTILKNTMLPFECQGMNKKEAEERSFQLLQEFGLGSYANSYPKDLSGGMRQRVAFIRALNAAEDVLFLDEPFSALDALTKVSLQQWLYEQSKRLNKTILFITHDVKEALYLSDRIFTIVDRPIQMLHETVVPLGHPRDRNQLVLPVIQILKLELLKLLTVGEMK